MKRQTLLVIAGAAFGGLLAATVIVGVRHAQNSSAWMYRPGPPQPVQYLRDTDWQAFRANEAEENERFCAEYLMWFPHTLPMPRPLGRRLVAETGPRPNVSYSIMHDRFEIIISGPARGHVEGQKTVRSILRVLEGLHAPAPRMPPKRPPTTKLAAQ